MNLDTYIFPGDGWLNIANQYGETAATRVEAAALSGDIAAVNAELSDIRRGTSDGNFTGSTSTLGNFWTQITTDPFSAPLDAANNQIGNVFKNIFKNPFVLLVLVGVVFYLVGGFDWVKRKVAAQ